MSDYICPRCKNFGVRHNARTVCTKCVSKEGNERTKAREAAKLSKPMQQQEANKHEGWEKITPPTIWKGWQFSASREYLSKSLFGVGL